MKYIATLFALIISLPIFCFNPVPGSILGELLFPNDIVRYRLQYVTDEDFYTNGGLTFTFPFTFPNPPRVYVSVFSAAFSPSITYVATIQSITTTDTTIRVNKITDTGGGVTTVTEALNGDNAFIMILAIEDPF